MAIPQWKHCGYMVHIGKYRAVQKHYIFVLEVFIGLR